MSIDFWMGCVWTLLAMIAGALITLVLVAVMGDRGEGPNDDYEDPGPDPQPVDFEWLESIVNGTTE